LEQVDERTINLKVRFLFQKFIGIPPILRNEIVLRHSSNGSEGFKASIESDA